MQFVIICKIKGTETWDEYCSLKARMLDDALVEAIEYLLNDGVPTTCHLESVFTVAQKGISLLILSKPLRAKLCCLAAIHNNREKARKFLLGILKGGETSGDCIF